MAGVLSPMEYDARLLDVPDMQEEAVTEASKAILDVVERLSAKERCLAVLRVVDSLELTALKATDTEEDVKALIDRAVHPLRDIFPSDWKRAKRCAGACFYPSLMKAACEHRRLRYCDEAPRLVTVCGGFPHGQCTLDTKLLEVKLAVDDGADEVDVVINRASALDGDWRRVYDEVAHLKRQCAPRVRMKTILAVGELRTLSNVYRASMVAMLAGSDFLKTSTGHEQLNANLRHAYVMCLAINQFHQFTGRRIGFKAAGGITSVDHALSYLFLVKRMLGDEWLSEHFRIGASSLLNEVIDSLKHLSPTVNLKQLLHY